MPLADLLAQDIDEARRRFTDFEGVDPFPNILPSLLNSADITDYVIKAAMLFPFYEADLKPASYAIRLKGRYIYFDNAGKKIVGIINEATPEFILSPNSIAFVTLEPYIQLPHYIATRFNLKINHIYKGLLLGTGPLVDPGFVGYLSIPLHNLTTNSYTFRLNETLIWMEFTKVSPNFLWDNSFVKTEEQQGDLKLFRVDKRNKTVDEYIHDAEQHRPIQSSIPSEFKKAQETATLASTAAQDARTAAQTAQGEVRTLSNRTAIINIAIVVTIMLGLGTLIYYINSSFSQSNKYLHDSDTIQLQMKEQITQQSQIIKRLELKIDSLTVKVRKGN